MDEYNKNRFSLTRELLTNDQKERKKSYLKILVYIIL